MPWYGIVAVVLLIVIGGALVYNGAYFGDE